MQNSLLQLTNKRHYHNERLKISKQKINISELMVTLISLKKFTGAIENLTDGEMRQEEC